MEPQFLTMPETLEVLNISRSHLYRLVARGELRIIRIGRCTRFAAEEVLAFAERVKEGMGRA
jgi:excisionase family DNA binding protein